ncbi:MAG: hypothetical protein LUH05_09250, partial [Candidatus Gastranaerophilales bacterium]|nr:hypothetical protein [Candidatus Gastranaerophilales bacterium]
MRKLLLLILTAMLTSVSCLAIEEVNLDLPQKNINLDYFSNIYYGEIDKNEEVSPVLKLFSENGLEFENSKINSVKMYFLYDGTLNFNANAHHSSHASYKFTSVEPMIKVRFNENKSEFMFDYNLTRRLEGYSNGFTERISMLYLSHKLNDNQTFIIGQADRLPGSYDGSRRIMQQDMILKSQLGRTLGNARAAGIRDKGKYKYIDYDIGLYDSTRYMKDFGNGLDFAGYVMLKPFADVNEMAGNFKIGSGYNIGHNNISYNMYSIFAGYDYKRLHIHSEYENADGYNAVEESKNRADGFYTTLIYDVTPKLSLIGRYDYFIANRDYKGSYCQEYSAGLTYNAFKNLKLMLNYVNKNYSNKPDSNMILFATR